jgi:hypothetical protein
LAGHDGGAAIVPIIDDLQEIARLIVCQRGKPPVIEDQKFNASDGLEQAGMAAVAARQRQGVAQPRHALIEDGAIVSAGLVTECAGKPTFADAGLADDDQILMSIDPISGGELLEQRFVDAGRRT